MHSKYKFTTLLLTFFVAGCSSSDSRYDIKNDHTPDNVPPLAHIEDATPHFEPYSRGGNKNYTVRGVNYKVYKDIDKFSETGYASWYGNKFHGHLTSNGERYNMFAMSGAHKNLPLPSYVKVTNLENNKQVIVRVNDRGPFHQGRIIDLSYAAAYKLDMLKAGTAKVKIELIKPSANTAKVKPITTNYYIQYLVTSVYQKAQQLNATNTKKFQTKGLFIEDNNHYKMRLGPINNETDVQALLLKVKQQYPNAYVISAKIK
ncbi:septal ring lytic transglycosylase RlpA family protein [Psychromonas sp. PT13]|uniref:septal ring lytic transglycosylase RlpA family protein n=1 Tax=Psychromonas sp. PT13 TaxID=3439547 RepID=UPI003EBEB21E